MLGSATAIAAATLVPMASSASATTTNVSVTSLADSGAGTLREALTQAANGVTTHITFTQAGTITLTSALPTIGRQVVIDGSATTGYVAGGAPVVGVNFNGSTGLSFVPGADGSQVLAMALGNASGDGVVIGAPEVTLAGNYIGLTTAGAAAPNTGDGVHLVNGSDGSVIGTNPSAVSSWVSNVISNNGANGVEIESSSQNTVAANRIGTNPAGTAAAANGANGILVHTKARQNVLGGTAYTDGVNGVMNNPTGSKNTVTPVFIRPPLGNVVSGNAKAGIVLLKGATDTTVAGNFIGTSVSGDSGVGNGTQGMLMRHAHRTQIVGCKMVNQPFVYYNVISGNGSYGIDMKSSNNVAIQGNFVGITADNSGALMNHGDGIWIHGTSKNTQAGGPIPLGNVTSGNLHNGIALTGKVSGFVSFNNFAGLLAFQGVAPNGLNGIYVEATGGNNLIRTSVTSGNTHSGIKLAGKAHGVTIDPAISGLMSDGLSVLANGGDGITIAGQAHQNVIGGKRKSVMPHTVISGNAGYGVQIMGHAHDNVMYNTYVGVGIGGALAEPNGAGGVIVTGYAHHNLIGGKKSVAARANIISGNTGNGVTLGTNTHANRVVNNYIGVGRAGERIPNSGENVSNGGKGNVFRGNTMK